METLAKATMRGDNIDDLESFDRFSARKLAQHGGRVPMDAVRFRRKIVMGYTSRVLQTVSDA
eukprot:1457828-Pyramimonas_sp.AAC.1